MVELKKPEKNKLKSDIAETHQDNTHVDVAENFSADKGDGVEVTEEARKTPGEKLSNTIESNSIVFSGLHSFSELSLIS